MARNVQNRLSKLRDRRRGLDRLMALDENARFDAIAKSVQDESYQKRAPNTPYTQYTLGAMQEVGPDYTRISVEEAQRVGKQLQSGLAAAGLTVDFRLQGSVPANIHIRGVSDVDLLTIDDAFFSYDANGHRARVGMFGSPI